jgi:hypothetical protein
MGDTTCVIYAFLLSHSCMKGTICDMTDVRSQTSDIYSNPTQPRASTREYAVVGATEVPTPMKDLIRP